jgi:hypothetical protein
VSWVERDVRAKPHRHSPAGSRTVLLIAQTLSGERGKGEVEFACCVATARNTEQNRSHAC